jgi:hypothetical protein
VTTRLRGRFSGYGYLPPGGGTGDVLVKLSGRDGDAGWSGVVDLQNTINTQAFVLLGEGTYDGPITINTLTVLQGIGSNSDASEGSIINGPVSVEGVQRVRLRDFGVANSGSQVPGVHTRSAYTDIDNVVVNGGYGGFLFGDETALTTAQLSAADAWQGTANNLRADNYTNYGIRVNSGGHTWELRNCTPRSSVDGAHGGYFNSPNVHVYGGQWGANNTGGRNLYWYNLRNGLLRGGSANDIRFENVDPGEYAVDIDGATRTFDHIMLNRLASNFTNGTTGTMVRFGKARYCWLNNPVIETPTGGGTLAEWTADSVGCGVYCDYMAAQAPIVVDPAAQNATKVVYGAITEADVPNITVAANLTTILVNGVIGQAGIFPFHNGSTWNF